MFGLSWLLYIFPSNQYSLYPVDGTVPKSQVTAVSYCRFWKQKWKKKEKYITCINICLTLIDIKLRHQLVIPIEISSRRIITVIKPWYTVFHSISCCPLNKDEALMMKTAPGDQCRVTFGLNNNPTRLLTADSFVSCFLPPSQRSFGEARPELSSSLSSSSHFPCQVVADICHCYLVFEPSAPSLSLTRQLSL